MKNESVRSRLIELQSFLLIKFDLDPETSFLDVFACFCGFDDRVFIACVRGEGVQGVLTLFFGGVAQTFHDDRVVELKNSSL